MPIYEYSCGACGHQLEKLQKMSDAPLSVCPACGQSTLKKLISAAGFQLKGSGWYATDSKPERQKTSSENRCPAAGACGTQCSGSASSE